MPSVTFTLTLGPAVIPTWGSGTLVGGTGALSDASDATYFAGDYVYESVSGSIPDDAAVTGFTTTVRATNTDAFSSYAYVYLLSDTEGAFNDYTFTFTSLPAGGPASITSSASFLDPGDVPSGFFSDPLAQVAIQAGSPLVHVHSLTVEITYETPSLLPAAPPGNDGWRLAALTPYGTYRMTNPVLAVLGTDIYAFRPSSHNGEGWNFPAFPDEFWSQSQKFSTITGLWSRVASPPEIFHTPANGDKIMFWKFAFAHGGDLYCMGQTDYNASLVWAVAARYTVSTDSWAIIGDDAHTTNTNFMVWRNGAYTDGVVLLVDQGSDSVGFWAWKYDVATNTFSHWPSLYASAASFAGSETGGPGAFYQNVGGTSSGSVHTSAIQVLDVATSTWSAGSPDPTDNGHDVEGRSIVYRDGQVWVIGGFDRAAASPDYYQTAVRIWDIATDTWSDGPVFPGPIAYTQPLLVGNDIWVVCGMYYDVDMDDDFTYNSVYTTAPPVMQISGVLRGNRTNFGKGRL